MSPFNDRSGFYRVSVVDPLQAARLSIHIALLTSDRRKKLVATLEGVGEPLSDGALIGALLRFPLELLLTTPRILYQAAKLHYRRRLDVYPRPEPHVDGGVAVAVNPVEGGGRAASVLWQDWAGGDARAVRLVGRSFEIACARYEEASGERVQVVFEAEDVARERLVVGPERSDRTLTIRYASPLVFTDLLMLPSAEAALLIGSHTERRWRVDDEALFRDLWTGPPQGRLVDALRTSHLRWSMSFASSSPQLSAAAGPRPRLGWSDSVALLRETWSSVASERLGYTIFGLTGARFVSGTEPWAAWARVGREQGAAKGDGFGSVLRARK